MSASRAVPVTAVPAYLADALKGSLLTIQEVTGYLQATHNAFADHIRAYGELVDAAARYAREAEGLRDVVTEIQRQADILEGAGAARTGEGATGGPQMALDVGGAAQAEPERPLGAGNAEALRGEGRNPDCQYCCTED